MYYDILARTGTEAVVEGDGQAVERRQETTTPRRVAQAFALRRQCPSLRLVVEFWVDDSVPGVLPFEGQTFKPQRRPGWRRIAP